MLTRSKNLKHLELGRSIQFCDFDLSEILLINPLTQLKSFSLRESENKELTITSVQLLLDSCPNLKSITEMRYKI